MSAKTLHEPGREVPVFGTFDVCVLGGGPAGIAAAATAARAGASTLLVERYGFLGGIVSRHVLTPDVIVGTRMPAYCTSSGLAILAALPKREVAAILDASNLIRHTQHTIHGRAGILARLEKVREIGYAHTEDELYLGDIATAFAVLDRDGRPMGAINVAVSRVRWKGAEDERRIASLLLDASRAISRCN